MRADAAIAIALFAAAAVAAMGGRANAAAIAAQLDYVAATGCPDATDFGAVVAEHLGYVPFRTDADERVVIRIETAGRALEGRIEWRNEAGRWAGERTFPSRTGDCGELVRAMGFAVALQFQLLAAAAPPGPERSPPGPGTPQPPAPVAVAPTPSVLRTGRSNVAAPGTESKAALAVGAGASAGVRLSPSVTAVGRLFGNVSWTHFAVELAAEVSVPVTMHRANGAGFSEQVLLAGIAGCGTHGRFGACLLGKVGEIRAAGEGVDLPSTAAGVFVEAGARVAVTQALGQGIQLTLRADGLAALTRGIVTLDSLPVWTTPRIAATFGVDLGVRFR